MTKGQKPAIVSPATTKTPVPLDRLATRGNVKSIAVGNATIFFLLDNGEVYAVAGDRDGKMIARRFDPFVTG